MVGSTRSNFKQHKAERRLLCCLLASCLSVLPLESSFGHDADPEKAALSQTELDPTTTPPPAAATPVEVPPAKDSIQPTAIPQEPPPRGVGMMVGGSVIVALLGVPLTSTGLLSLVAINAAQAGTTAITGDETSTQDEYRAIRRGIYLVQVLPGLLSLAGGTVMIVFGAKRYQTYEAWKHQRYQASRRLKWTPFAGSTPMRTGVYGVQGRF